GTGATYTLANGTPDAGSGGGYSWTAFENITDATGTVDFATSGSVTGDVTADVLDYDSYTQDLTLDITAGTITNGGVGGTVTANTVNANAAQTNTVTGTGATYTLANGTPDAGSGGGYSWTAFENITDATGTVDFATSGSVTGDVTADVLDYSGYGSAVTFDLANGAGATTGIGGTWSGVTAVTGSGNSDTLTAGAVTLTLANGTPDAGSDGAVSWTSFENINAATATVDFAVSGSVTGDVTADVLDYDSY